MKEVADSDIEIYNSHYWYKISVDGDKIENIKI